MKDFNKNIYFFLTVAVSIALVILKSNTLQLPFYWDEAWVYGPAVKKMGESLCFLPSCASNLTRGHPLLFHFIGGIWIKIFGDSFFSLHSFALFLTILFQWSCYYIGKKLLNNFFAFAFSTLVISQNIIFAQSSLVLPEIILGAFCVWTFYFFYTKNLKAYLIAGTLLCLVKEQGAVLIVALAAWNFFENCKQSEIKKTTSLKIIKETTLFISPLFLLVCFLGLQKVQKGYFFFPEHLHLIKSDLRQIVYHFKFALNDVCIAGGRWFISVVFIFIFLFNGKIKPVATRVVILLLLLVIVKSVSLKWGLPIWLIILTVPTFSFLIFYRIFVVHQENSIQTKLQGICLFFILFYLFFCSINFFTNRYLVCIIPFFLLFIFTEIYYSFENKKTIQFFITSTLMVFSFFSCYYFKGFTDYSPRYFQAIAVQKNLINYAIKNGLKEKRVLASFVFLNNMVHPEAGFVKPSESFSNCTNVLDGQLPEFIFDSNFDHDSLITKLVNSNQYFLEKQINVGEAQGKIFKLK